MHSSSMESRALGLSRQVALRSTVANSLIDLVWRTKSVTGPRELGKRPSLLESVNCNDLLPARRGSQAGTSDTGEISFIDTQEGFY
jgi:hypothetical protein